MSTGVLKAVLAGTAMLASARATTLEKLSLDDMIRQSTGIVRARVTGSRGVLRGENIYTYYRLEVLETAKTDPALSVTFEKVARENAGREQARREIEVAVPGGAVNGMRQVAEGAPELAAGSEYVVFLWTGKSGMTQIIGLSQGLFRVEKSAEKGAAGDLELSRPAADELMIDQYGHRVADQPAELRWSELRARIRRDLGRAEAGPGEARK